MNWKTWIPLVLAIVLGLVAAKVARDVLSREKKPVAQGNFKQIVVTKHSLPPGSEIKPDDLQLAPVGADNVPEQSFSSISEVLSRTTKVEMVKGQAIVEPLLAEKGTGSGLQALVPAGMRAITIEVNEFSGVGGMIAPRPRGGVVGAIQGSGGGGVGARNIRPKVENTGGR